MKITPEGRAMLSDLYNSFYASAIETSVSVNAHDDKNIGRHTRRQILADHILRVFEEHKAGLVQDDQHPACVRMTSSCCVPDPIISR